MRTEPQRRMIPALSNLGRYFTDSLHSFIILFNPAEAEQAVAFPDATLPREFSSFPADSAPHYWRHLARFQGNRSFPGRLQGIHNPLNRRRHSIQ